jgi:hypothetical protein
MIHARRYPRIVGIAGTLFLAVVVAGCSDTQLVSQSKRGQPEDSSATGSVVRLPQGVHGRVIRQTGDFTLDPPTGQRLPLLAPVHVFRGQLQPIEHPDPEHQAFIKIVMPDNEGRFELSLPAGEYTLVAEIDGRLYLNNWLEDGSWATCIVPPGEWVNYTIKDFRDTTY